MVDIRGLEMVVANVESIRDKPESSTYRDIVIPNAQNLNTQRQNSLTSRMSPAKLHYLIRNLDLDQVEAVKDIGFGAFLDLGFGELFPKLNLWLVQNFDPYSRTLYLKDGKLKINAEDVKLTLGLPMGPNTMKEAKNDDENEQYTLLLTQWRGLWEIEKGSPITSQMCTKILTLGSGDDFKRSFSVFVVSSCLSGHKGAKSNYKILLSLVETRDISLLNWCQYTIESLTDAVKNWRMKPSSNFKGPFLFLMLFYFDRVEFMGAQVERKVPVIASWNSSSIGKRIKEELQAGRFGLGRIVPPLSIDCCGGTSRVNIELPRDSHQTTKEEFAAEICSITKELADKFVEFGQAMAKIEKVFPMSESIKSIQRKANDVLTKFFEIQSYVNDFDAFLGQPGVLEEIEAIEKKCVEEIKEKSNQKRISMKTCTPKRHDYDGPSFSLGIDDSPHDSFDVEVMSIAREVGSSIENDVEIVHSSLQK